VSKADDRSDWHSPRIKIAATHRTVRAGTPFHSDVIPWVRYLPHTPHASEQGRRPDKEIGRVLHSIRTVEDGPGSSQVHECCSGSGMLPWRDPTVDLRERTSMIPDTVSETVGHWNHSDRTTRHGRRLTWMMVLSVSAGCVQSTQTSPAAIDASACVRTQRKGHPTK
jgi:hypothetical protein